METKILTEEQISQGVQLLSKGSLVAFPTETVYGLGADATNDEAVQNVYRAKGRPSDNPLIVHVNSVDMVKSYVKQLPQEALQLMKTFWPGPLTIILPIEPDSLPQHVTGGLKTVAFRMPDNKLTLKLITQFNRPIVGPSANTSTKPSPTTAKHVYHDLNGKISAILDGGQTQIGLESTVIDLSVEHPVILRPGKISQKKLQEVLNQPVLMNHLKPSDNVIPKAPGMKYRHYAPSASVYVVDDVDDFLNIVKLKDLSHTAFVAEESIIKKLESQNLRYHYILGHGVAEAANKLFDALRFFDDNQDINEIFVQGFSGDDLEQAYMNRLNKAASGQHYQA
ncbi:L-threonylcarbamoyladenylate synthase [Holzapfeliella floricola]|uniref:Threonylcarbamoyl-AMP synthase n=1 Tax=Holzapfeliella floricola DSM 23037 = JCM 16512 TaxID=1423744 RepID=A0A0R2DP29_9LACO|nr:L-threonylcarbamoyladenylate synthase [Holzapfeliella floricola]KRN03557.1 Sua5 YciO YrdC YwlC family protein [Holzapfeliella floricola DSM 23037 = JCM 16512]